MGVGGIGSARAEVNRRIRRKRRKERKGGNYDLLLLFLLLLDFNICGLSSIVIQETASAAFGDIYDTPKTVA